MARWLLPENISDVLPDEARRVEQLRRVLLDLYRSYGYELVFPPLLEYLDSLLTGTGGDLDLRTFKLVDQASGRMMGLRADTTPQVARIDAHILNRNGLVRLCYSGSVLHARPLHPLATREPLQVGAELYGYEGLPADAEMLTLAAASLRLADVKHVHFDLGHTALVRAVLDADPAATAIADEILAALNAKDEPALRARVHSLSKPAAEAILALVRLHGGIEILAEARRTLPGTARIRNALDDLERLAQESDADEITIDLADSHGYRYHAGVTFAAHARGVSSAILRGGRYDGVGRAFGRARPATGFSVYLRELAQLSASATPQAILAPAVIDAALHALVQELRKAGEVVIQLLPGERRVAADGDFEFSKEIRLIDGQWRLAPRL